MSLHVFKNFPKGFSVLSVKSLFITTLTILLLCGFAYAQQAFSTAPSTYEKKTLHITTLANMKSKGSIRKYHFGTSKVLSVYNVFGQLTKIVEPDKDGKPTIVTEYTWNSQGKLTSITQYGNPGDSPRIRTFTYDNQGHILSTTNPENGTSTYTYQKDGHLKSKTDARGIITHYAWDAKGHLTGKQYSNGDPSVFYFYDDNSGKIINSYLETTKGRIGERKYHYNAQGNLDRIIQSGENDFFIALNYDSAGNVNEIHYPDGRVIRQNWVSTGPLNSITDQNGTVYFSNTQYDSKGILHKVQLGNGITVKQEFNHRGYLNQLHVQRWNQTILNKYFYHTRFGNVDRMEDELDPKNTIIYSFDNLLRVSKYSQLNGEDSQNYSYDAFGNLDLKSNFPFQQSYDANNHIKAASGLTYDSAGDMIFDGVHQY
jgi:YD repeat-containing protein